MVIGTKWIEVSKGGFDRALNGKKESRREFGRATARPVQASSIGKLSLAALMRARFFPHRALGHETDRKLRFARK